MFLSWITTLLWWRGMHNSMKLWAMPRRTTQDGWGIVQSSDKMDPLEEGIVKHSSILALRTPWKKVWRGKKRITPEDEFPGQKVNNMLWGKSRGQLLTAPERMKQLGQSRSDAQLWMPLEGKVKSEAVKKIITSESGMLGPWVKVNWCGQAGDSKSEHQHLRN